MNPLWLAAGASGSVALLLVPPPGWVQCRIDPPPPRTPGEARWLGVRRGGDDPFATAASYDLLAVCLRAGMPVAAAAEVVSRSAPAGLADTLHRAAELLELGADPAQAWEVDDDASPAAVSLSAMARRSARAGSSPVRGLTELSEAERAGAADRAAAAAERAGVAVAGPLGLCFLPAFVCLGIVPVVIGLAGRVLGGGVL
ncbi:type II secretion system F family protein [Williamsia sp. CHRR-6]|uniref:type II secretion system F family protein n=1 Tax=Williamsia sp. CHRR-6 TaxID=2835871 RepID=UPI001BD9ED95|nr:type II secretion system F family protein [Williamsia sp. CHRR-6]MBT0567133.1 type II secretion system F family protein [Williamsia sp. CHRR-6]